MSVRCLLVSVFLLGAFPCQGGLAEKAKQIMTPVLLRVQDAPIPFHGSDGRTHLVYELLATNFSSGDVALEQVEVLDGGKVLFALDRGAVARDLQSAGLREASATMARSTQALVFLHVVLEQGMPVPRQLAHRVTLRASAAPPGEQEFVVTGGAVEVDRRKVAVIGPPLTGEGYVSADSCCDAVRHTRAALPVNGRLWLAQRYAVDWEQISATGRIYSGPSEDVRSYEIFGKPVLAVADAVVSSVVDGLSEQTPGKFPTRISLDGADGNAVVLKIGDQQFALYAHMQPGSIKVRAGDRVKRGQVLGLVGNTGNSLAPHLHFQLMDGPLSLGSNGLPYEIDAFSITGKTPGTEAFDEAEAKGVPIPVTPFSPALAVRAALPLDQQIISFGKGR